MRLEQEEDVVKQRCPYRPGGHAASPWSRSWSWSGSHRSGSIVDAALGRGGAASLVALTRVDGHAHASVSAVAMVTGARVLVRTRVDAGGVDVAHLLETRVDG